jgi:hypothetical protein
MIAKISSKISLNLNLAVPVLLGEIQLMSLPPDPTKIMMLMRK